MDSPDTKIKNIGIIGFSKVEPGYDADFYDHIVKTMTSIITKYPDAHFISGGSVWADHIPLTLFLSKRVTKLTLHLPDKWDHQNKKFAEWHSPGKILNTLHKQFSEILGHNTLEDIDQAIKLGATYTVSPGFLSRNTLISNNSDELYVIIMKDKGMNSSCKNLYNKFPRKKITLVI
jgi:hypothetical protein